MSSVLEGGCNQDVVGDKSDSPCGIHCLGQSRDTLDLHG